MRGRLTKLYDFQANGRQPCDNITAGDIVAFSGLDVYKRQGQRRTAAGGRCRGLHAPDPLCAAEGFAAEPHTE